MRLSEAQRGALQLLSIEGSVGADDPRVDQYSDDGNPDTWNQLFESGLAEQSGPGWSGDDFILRITPAGRAALEQDR
jgi:hypothetical protein